MLSGFLAELQGLITHRAEAIAARMADPSIRGTAEIADFMLLQSMNRAEPLLRHLLGRRGQRCTPRRSIEHCIVLAGENSPPTLRRAGARQCFRPIATMRCMRPVSLLSFADLRTALSSCAGTDGGDDRR